MSSPVQIAPTPKQGYPIEILDLRHFTGRQLRALLEEEAAVWCDRLRWEYTASTELLIQYLDSQILPGFVALERGKVVGFCFCVYEGTKAVIGDVYVAEATPGRAAVTETLVRHLLEVLESSPETDRIEAQLLLFDPDTVSRVFTASGFRAFRRLFMELELGPQQQTTPSQDMPSTLELCRWNPGLYHAAAELIHAAYAGHIDSEINDQYRTLAGSLRFLHNIVRFPGCGTFDPEASWALRERGSGTLAGLVLCSKLKPEVAHVTQLCLGARFRGHGLGRALLRHATAQLAVQGYRALTLTVSLGNDSALELYRSAGFTTRQEFEALVLDKAEQPERFGLQLPNGMRADDPDDASTEPEPKNESGGGLFSFARRKTIPGRR